MVSKKKILFFTDGPRISDAQLILGRAIGAQFRNARLVEGDRPEPCDYVAGAIPKVYEDYPVFPEEAAEAIAGTAEGLLGGTPEGTEEQDDPGLSQEPSDNPDDTQDETSSDEGEEVEITLDLLNRMDKEELLDIADQEDVTLTNTQKKSAPKIRTALADHFDLQE